jgi:hypothetical protein
MQTVWADMMNKSAWVMAAAMPSIRRVEKEKAIPARYVYVCWGVVSAVACSRTDLMGNRGYVHVHLQGSWDLRA